MPVQKVLTASVFGGLTIFVWGAISHMVLPFYNDSLLRFSDEAAVTLAVLANAPASGVYFMPYEPTLPPEATEAERRAANEAMMKQMSNGPFVLAAIRVGPMSSISLLFVTQLVTDILSAMLLTLLLWNARSLSYRGRIGFAVGVALVIVCASTLPSWNWYAFSTSFTLAEAFDHVVGFALAGAVIGKVVPGGQRLPGGNV